MLGFSGVKNPRGQLVPECGVPQSDITHDPYYSKYLTGDIQEPIDGWRCNLCNKNISSSKHQTRKDKKHIGKLEGLTFEETTRKDVDSDGKVVTIGYYFGE